MVSLCPATTEGPKCRNVRSETAKESRHRASQRVAVPSVRASHSRSPKVHSSRKREKVESRLYEFSVFMPTRLTSHIELILNACYEWSSRIQVSQAFPSAMRKRERERKRRENVLSPYTQKEYVPRSLLCLSKRKLEL